MITPAMRCLCVILLTTTVFAANDHNETATTAPPAVSNETMTTAPPAVSNETMTTAPPAVSNETATTAPVKPTQQCSMGHFRCASGLCIVYDAVCDDYLVHIHSLLI